MINEIEVSVSLDLAKLSVSLHPYYIPFLLPPLLSSKPCLHPILSIFCSLCVLLSIPLLVCPILCVPTRTYFTLCISILCVLIRTYFTLCISHFVCASLTPCVSRSICLTPCMSRSYMSHSVCLLLLSCLPIPSSTPPVSPTPLYSVSIPLPISPTSHVPLLVPFTPYSPQ